VLPLFRTRWTRSPCPRLRHRRLRLHKHVDGDLLQKLRLHLRWLSPPRRNRRSSEWVKCCWRHLGLLFVSSFQTGEVLFETSRSDHNSVRDCVSSFQLVRLCLKHPDLINSVRRCVSSFHTNDVLFESSRSGQQCTALCFELPNR
jgi:hypothetical protein